MKYNKFLLSAMALGGALALLTATGWSAGEKASGSAGSEGIKTQAEGSSARESGKPSSAEPGAPASRESGKSAMRGGEERSQGHSAETVKQVQQALKEKGHDPGAIDGIMGPRTQQALRSFQQKEGLKATGALNEETAQKLGVSMAGSGEGKMGAAGREEPVREPGAGAEQTPTDPAKRARQGGSLK